MFGLNKYDPQYKRIYICEGEWDTMALDMLAGELGKKYNIVGVPGASTFKPEWLELFRDKEVVSLYDNDEAGEKGEVNAQKRLAGIAESMWFVHWPVDAPTGFDVRDWIRYGLKIEKPIGCWKNLHTLLKSEPRIISIAEKVVIRQQSTIEGTASIEDVFRTYKKWLHSEHDRPDAITIAFAVCMANRLEGDPVWLFFVGPPGSMKSELLMSLSDHTTVYATTSLTTKTLISGAPTFSAKDPSLIPQLNGKILICKDFTSILTMQYMVRDEIFGILRDAYDGKIEKVFGTGLRRSYRSKFGILAGVTSKIESFTTLHQSLGERFLKFRLVSEDRTSEEARIFKALANFNHEIQMRIELSNIACKSLNRELPKDIPTPKGIYVDKIVALARFTALMRGVVERNQYNQMVLYRPSQEVGTRLAKQLSKLGIGIAMFLGHQEFKDEEIRIVSKVARDTCPELFEIIVRRIWAENKEFERPIRTSQVAWLTRLPVATISRVLQDMELLQIVNRHTMNGKTLWTLNRSITSLIEKIGMYNDEQPRLYSNNGNVTVQDAYDDADHVPANKLVLTKRI